MKTSLVTKILAGALAASLSLGAFAHSAGQKGVAVDINGGPATPDGGGLRLGVGTILTLRFASAEAGDTVKVTLRGETDEGNDHGALNMVWGALPSGGSYPSFNGGGNLYESSYNYQFTNLVDTEKTYTFSSGAAHLMEMKVTGLGTANYFRIDALEVEIDGKKSVATYNCGPVAGGDLSCTADLY